MDVGLVGLEVSDRISRSINPLSKSSSKTVADPVAPESMPSSRAGQNVDEVRLEPGLILVICVGSNRYRRIDLKPNFADLVVPESSCSTNLRPESALGLSKSSSFSMVRRLKNSYVSTAFSRLWKSSKSAINQRCLWVSMVSSLSSVSKRSMFNCATRPCPILPSSPIAARRSGRTSLANSSGVPISCSARTAR